jgi:hypothetical protein
VEREIEEAAALDKVRERMRDVELRFQFTLRTLEQDEKGMGLGKHMKT